MTVNVTGANYDRETNESVSLFGNYDTSSIMQYCTDQGVTVKGGGAPPCNRSALTQQDIIGIQVMYGSEFEPTADVSSWGPDRLDILFRGTDGQVMKTAWFPPKWEQNLALGGSVVGSPNGVSWGSDRYDIFARGGELAMWHRAWNGSGWDSLAPAVPSRTVLRNLPRNGHEIMSSAGSQPDITSANVTC